MAAVTQDANENMINYAISYGRILMLGQSLFMLQYSFQSFFPVAEKPMLGFLFNLAAGIANMTLDALFIAGFRMGVMGAAFATLIGYAIASIGPLLYFIIKKDGIIHLGKAKWYPRALFHAASNGVSEFISNISGSIVSVVYNLQLLHYYGEKGVSAYGIIMYVSFIFIAIFIGYSIGMAPVIGFHYGAGNGKELRNVLVKSILIIIVTSLVMFGLGELLAVPFSRIFSGGDEELLQLSVTAMRIFSIVFLFCGMSIFFSSFFTALNNGIISGLISLIRTLVLQIAFVFLFPLIFGVIGIWWGIVASEIIAWIISLAFVQAKRKKYGYSSR